MSKHKINVILFISIGVILFGYLCYRVYSDFFKAANATKEIDSISLYGYSLKKNDTGEFKDEFENLTEILNSETVDYDSYAKSISKLFIIDLYTLTNKVSSTDIGGIEYLYPDFVTNFSEDMGSSLYKYVENNLDGKRTQELPEVDEVTIDNIFETKYEYDGVEYDSYVVSSTWTYKVNLDYQTSIKLTIIKKENKLYIVKGE